jgi:hypothetical protein
MDNLLLNKKSNFIVGLRLKHKGGFCTNFYKTSGLLDNIVTARLTKNKIVGIHLKGKSMMAVHIPFPYPLCASDWMQIQRGMPGIFK